MVVILVNNKKIVNLYFSVSITYIYFYEIDTNSIKKYNYNL